MAQQVKIAGTTYNDVPYIQCPDENDVLHKFLDTTINASAATAEDIANGKKAYANGSLILGTNTGEVPDGSITTVKLANGAVTNAKIGEAVSIANGGTGQTGLTSETTVSNIFTTNSNATINTAACTKWGKIAILNATFKLKASLAANGTVSIGTLKTGYKPVLAAFVGSSSLIGTITTSGDITIRNTSGSSISTSTTCYIQSIYLIS